MRRLRPDPKALRCAIYTRVSTDHGLDQDFNSLDAQREACEAYVKSQAPEGWHRIRDRFDDGGFSGGSIERPALQQLLAEVRARKVDVIVVYKVDRLTRSLADFAKLVELFDAQGVSFVSVTQSFNTTSSMGRLTLNVLLSFAQFEREVTGERIRDKIAASKQKGIWVGGVVPLGYRVCDRKLVVDSEEAATVTMIFEQYRALGSITALAAELRQRKVLTRRRTLSSGRVIGGIPFTKGPLAHLLKNRTYLGEINHRGRSYKGEHAAIAPADLFEAVAQMLACNAIARSKRRSRSGALLLGKLFDDRGNRMTASFAQKGGVRYRYYVSRAVEEGNREKAGAIRRVAAPQVEAAIVAALRAEPALSAWTDASTLGPDGSDAVSTASRQDADRLLIARAVVSVTLDPAFLTIGLTDEAAEACGAASVQVSWSKPPGRVRRDVMAPAGCNDAAAPIRSDTRATLLLAIAHGRAWLDELVARSADVAGIAAREKRSRRYVHMMVSLAFLAPDIVQATFDGRLPRGIGVSRLIDLPPEWDRQRKLLGLVAS